MQGSSAGGKDKEMGMRKVIEGLSVNLQVAPRAVKGFSQLPAIEESQLESKVKKAKPIFEPISDSRFRRTQNQFFKKETLSPHLIRYHEVSKNPYRPLKKRSLTETSEAESLKIEGPYSRHSEQPSKLTAHSRPKKKRSRPYPLNTLLTERSEGSRGSGVALSPRKNESGGQSISLNDFKLELKPEVVRLKKATKVVHFDNTVRSRGPLDIQSALQRYIMTQKSKFVPVDG